MPHRPRFASSFTLLLLAACSSAPATSTNAVAENDRALQGAWRSKITMLSGPMAAMKDLEFLCVYNLGGTMTESSNYDEAANSSPPAYGVWQHVDARTFRSKYVFYTTRPPGPDDGAPSKADWWPAGHGVITETITLADDGESYTSAIQLALFDKAEAPIEGGGVGTGAGSRIGF